MAAAQLRRLQYLFSVAAAAAVLKVAAAAVLLQHQHLLKLVADMVEETVAAQAVRLL